MQYEDRLSIPTPEGVDLELTLAGVGSRFVAGLLDQVVQWSVIVALMVLAGVLRDGDGLGGAEGAAATLAMAAFVVLVFAVQLLYDVSFETLASGRTPGKRWTGLRVVRLAGAPVGFVTTAVRNLRRSVDVLPGFYGVGLVAVLASRRNQRLGDMAAGTLVVRERGARRRARARPWSVPATRDWTTWDVSSVTADEVATVRRFLERRETITPEDRSRLSAELARRLRPKVVSPDAETTDAEGFLEAVAAAKAARS